jgi:S1-C subfamily serine protease
MKRASIALFSTALATVALDLALLFGAHHAGETPLQHALNTSVTITDKVTEEFFDGSPDIVTHQQVCSGFVAGTDGTTEVIITAAHCAIDEVDTVGGHLVESDTGLPESVQFFDGDTGTVQDAFINGKHDIMLLVVSSKHLHESAKTQTKFQLGDDFFTIGMANGVDWTYGRAFSAQGPFEFYDPDDKKTSGRGLYQIGTTDMGHGNSGGAVFDKNGEVVGIYDCDSQDLPDQGFMVAAKYIDRVLTLYYSSSTPAKFREAIRESVGG